MSSSDKRTRRLVTASGEPERDHGHDSGVSTHAAAAEGGPLALVIDDSPFLARQLAGLLETLGMHACIPADATELHALAPDAAVICVELELFHASGFEVTRALADRCACPLVLVSGTGRNTDLQWGLRAGASAVLQRPVTTPALRATLASIGCEVLH